MQFDQPDLSGWYDADRFATHADRWFDQLRQQLPWTTHHIRLFGRLIASPRLSCWVADEGLSYTYSGLTLGGNGWPECLQNIRAAVEQACHTRFNGVLANWYRDGQDSMGWHRDNERELGPAPTIASLTLGQARRFSLKHATRRDLDRIDIDLAHGSLLLLDGPTQAHWLHAVPKTKRPLGDRINLTFRSLLS